MAIETCSKRTRMKIPAYLGTCSIEEPFTSLKTKCGLNSDTPVVYQTWSLTFALVTRGGSAPTLGMTARTSPLDPLILLRVRVSHPIHPPIHPYIAHKHPKRHLTTRHREKTTKQKTAKGNSCLRLEPRCPNILPFIMREKKKKNGSRLKKKNAGRSMSSSCGRVTGFRNLFLSTNRRVVLNSLHNRRIKKKRRKRNGTGKESEPEEKDERRKGERDSTRSYCW